ncbi:hypothetical protein [uncultured Gimesia sp.]|uniref:hypothetical protein n=1 Tax=uncultured Gimesia sp. TaxID=1678688 RepID=UPI00261B9421|nr:hypothetical protein [uncultured Gimesia sp.]
MNSEIKDNQSKRRRNRIMSIICLILIAYWLLTWIWGTSQVHQDYVKLNRQGLPPKYRLFEDRRPDDVNTVWALIAYPHAPLPGIVSLEVDYGAGMSIWGGPVRQYFFWIPGYHSKTPFWGREVYGTYEEND